MVVQFAVRTAKANVLQFGKAAVSESIEITADGVFGDMGEATDLLMPQPLAFQPDHFHAELDPGMRMVIAIIKQVTDVGVGESQVAHGWPPRCCSALPLLRLL